MSLLYKFKAVYQLILNEIDARYANQIILSIFFQVNVIEFKDSVLLIMKVPHYVSNAYLAIDW